MLFFSSKLQPGLRLGLCMVPVLLGLASCRSTLPDVDDLDHYEKQSAELAKVQIAQVEERYNRGEINQKQRDADIEEINANIIKKAHDLAWAHHELKESEKRAWGLPTGDSPVTPAPPQLGQISNSFYVPKGEVGSGFGSFNNPTMGTNYRRGLTPQYNIQESRDRAIPSEHRRYMRQQEEVYYPEGE